MNYSRIRRVLVAAVIMGVVMLPPLLMSPAKQDIGEGDRSLVVMTSHNEQIRYEFDRAFREWHQSEYGETVAVDWRAISGSSEMANLLKSRYSALAARGQEDLGAGYDIVFGGGEYLFDAILKRGITHEGMVGTPRKISLLSALSFDEDWLATIYGANDVAGRPLYDDEGYWWGVALSSFGIVYNRDVLDYLELPEPKRWADLKDPRYYNWIAIADPSHSASARVTYEVIMQRYGFEEGWATLRRICANARYLSAESSQVPNDVSLGEVAAGMAVDFFGRYQEQIVGSDRVGFVLPARETTVNADPVAVLHGAPNHETAERFVKFLLSQRGQGLWNNRVRTEDGPDRFALRRSPIRRDTYQVHASRMIDDVSPYDIAEPLPPGVPSYFSSLPTVMHSLGVDIQGDLKRAWMAVVNEEDAAQKESMLVLFDALPFDPDELQEAVKSWRTDAEKKTHDRHEWTAFFKRNYEEVVAISEGRSIGADSTAMADRH